MADARSTATTTDGSGPPQNSIQCHCVSAYGPTFQARRHFCQAQNYQTELFRGPGGSVVFARIDVASSLTACVSGVPLEVPSDREWCCECVNMSVSFWEGRRLAASSSWAQVNSSPPSAMISLAHQI